jgi:hypothetical protein
MLQFFIEASQFTSNLFNNCFTIGLLLVCFSSGWISYLESSNTEHNRDNDNCNTRKLDSGKTSTTLIKANEKTDTFEELLIKVNELFQHIEKPRIPITNLYLIDMKAAELLERLDHLQVQAKSIVPYLSMSDNPWNNFQRRESNPSDSSLSTNVTDFSNMSAISSPTTTNTSVDTHSGDIDDCISRLEAASQQPVQIPDASFEKVIQCSADLMVIKTRLCQILNLDLPRLMQLTHVRCTKQVYRALGDLIKVCMDIEMKLNAFQHQPAFIRIAYDTASRALQASKEAFAQKLTACHEKDDFKGQDLHELSFSVNETSDLVYYYLKLQQGNTTVKDQILDVRFRMIKLCYDRVEFAYQQIDGLRQIIQEGIQQLDVIQTCQQDAVLLMFKVQDIFSSIYDCVSEKIQPLVSILSSSLENDLSNHHSLTHGLIQHLVDLIFKDLDVFKSKFNSTICKSQNIDVQVIFKEKAETSIEDLRELNTSICNFTLMEALWSKDTTNKQPTTMQAQLDSFQARLTDICTYFRLNYQKLGDNDLDQDLVESVYEIHTLVDRASVLLKYADQALQQRQAASRFMERAALFQGLKNQPLEEAASLSLEFKVVNYPMVDIQGLYNLVYVYQRDIYLTLSQVYVDTMNLSFTNL